MIGSGYHFRLHPGRPQRVCPYGALVLRLLETSCPHLILLKRGKLVFIAVKNEHMCSGIIHELAKLSPVGRGMEEGKQLQGG